MHKFNDIKEAMEVATAIAILKQMVADVGGTIYFSDHKACLNCVNVHLPTGAFICTAYYNSLLNNIYSCINFVAEVTYNNSIDDVDVIAEECELAWDNGMDCYTEVYCRH